MSDMAADIERYFNDVKELGRLELPEDRDPLILRCKLNAAKLYEAHGTLSHESVARSLGRFIAARVEESTPSPERDLVRALANHSVKIATYFSLGRDQIITALAHLLRMAAAWPDHPDFDPNWSTT
jgi:hypothetical protein